MTQNGIMSNQVFTFGCRLNSYESEVIKSHLDAGGQSNTLVFNGCAVTAEAERQLRQAIRKARKENPDSKIVVTGCAAQISPDKYAAMPEVDSVIGNEEKLKAESYLLPIENKQLIAVNDIMSVSETALHLIQGMEGRVRAFLQVQNGCNHRCTFCIIPYGRGNSRSVAVDEVIAQARALVENGHKEIVITGVDISDYGRDFNSSLGQLCRQILKNIPELPRLRISSIDAVEVDDDLLHLIATEDRLMPHLHLSLQAGDDMILKRMKRRHLRQDAIDFCNKVRELRPDVVFGADIIAGFPTETDEMFENSIRLVDECDITYLHVFPYSERPGTPAAKMPQVAKPVRKERAARLRAVGDVKLNDFLKRQIGKNVEVLVENSNIGRTRHFAEVEIGKSLPVATLVRVEVTSVNGNRLVA